MKKWVPLAVGSATILLTAISAWAAPYFEFNPDYAQSMLVASAPGAVSEVFLPANEYLAGFDLWVSNGSTAGPVTFTLYGPSGAVMAARTVTVPAIADSESGNRFTVSIAQLPVDGSSTHRIGIATNVPSFRLYYAEQNRIIAHNGVPLPAYTGGIARIGSEDQGFSFKFALSENTESSAPQLTGVAVRQPGIGTAVIDFNANEPVDARVQHNEATVPFSGQYSSCLSGIVPCSVTLQVTPGISYAYTLTVRDVWGNESSAAGQFTADGTPPDYTPTPTPSGAGTPTPTPTPSAPPDTSSPVVSNLRAIAITTTGAGIAWTTDEAANSLVIVQSMPFLINAGGGSDGTFELEHLVSVSGLDSDSLFQARVTSSDLAGNSTVATISFKTLSAIPTPPSGSPTPTPTPTPSASTSPTPTPIVSIGPTSGGAGGETAHWSPPASGPPANGYRIDIIGSDGKLIRTIRTKETSANVGDVPDGATVVVYGDNGGVYEKVGAPAKVRRVPLMERLITALPYILGGIFVAIAATIAALKFHPRRSAPPPTGGHASPTGGSLKDQAEAKRVVRVQTPGATGRKTT